ncbi:MAG: transposase [Lachnospiraceae bacterium]|nr:transposase [Lachnospiraceae bacterium]
MSYIHYDQKPNGVIYASLYESFRDKGKVKTRRMENLGRVIDKENNIFRQKGIVYQYVLGEGRKEVPPSDLPSEPVVPEIERLILDFGDAWFLQEYLSKQPFYGSILKALPDESDTLLALIFYRLLTNKGANCHAKVWYEGNYSYLAFPHANLTGQNISRVLKELGREETQRRFFEEYMSSIYGNDGTVGILVDSTGVPNATKMDITQISNHNGDINREVRLIYVIDRENGMPIYFRYVAGNIIDVSTLITTVSELEQYGVSVSHAILDAGYFSEKNASELFESGIPFMTRLAPNKTAFKDAAPGNLDDLMSQKYAHRYGERLVFIKKVPVNVCGYEAYVYLCIDEDMYLMQHKKAILNALDNKKDFNETDAEVKQLGVFAILTSEELSEDKLLPMYYTRQQVEQVFDISKNYADLLPIRVQSEQAFAGHLLVCFMATAIMQKLQQELLKRRSKKAKSLNAESIFMYLRNQKCKVYEDYAIPQEPRKEVNAIYDIFKVQVPYKIPLTTIEV